jgi:hypothetical protein
MVEVALHQGAVASLLCVPPVARLPFCGGPALVRMIVYGDLKGATASVEQ